MNYTYEFQINSNDLKNLNHIEWFVAHWNEYEYKNNEMLQLIDNLKRYITKKNIFYYILVRDYNKLVDHFYNNPYDYKYNVLSRDPDLSVETRMLFNYFIEVKDEEGNLYRVPYQYIFSTQNTVADRNQVQRKWKEHLTECKQSVMDNFIAVNKHCEEYYNSGVAQAIDAYDSVAYGKDYHFWKNGLLLFFFNMILVFILREECFFQVLLHFWQYFSYSGVYSAYYVFSGHSYQGLFAMLVTALFIYYDLAWIYGYYYNLYTNQKFKAVFKHHQQVQKYYLSFVEDFHSLNDPLGERIEKKEKRHSVYIPLIRETSRRFDFKQKKKNGEDGFHSVTVEDSRYQSLNPKGLCIAIVVFAIYVVVICLY